jgi:hypothetical protein
MDCRNPNAGFNAAFSYTLMEHDVIGGSAHALEIDLAMKGGSITLAWMNGLNVSTASKADAQGEAMLTMEGMSYQRSLVAGDTITLSVQGKGVDFDQTRAKFSFTGTDAAPNMHGLRTGAGATNDWAPQLNGCRGERK